MEQPSQDVSAMQPDTGANLTLPILSNGNPSKTITEDEIALYDRQIRLWGIAAQAKIQSSSILLITLRALSSEIAKNLVLSGISSLTILDSSPVTPPDLSSFLLPDDSLGRNRAEAAVPALQKLNPRVRVVADAQGVKAKGPSYFSAFDVVIATDLDPETLNLINTATRINNKPFYAAGTQGLYGYIFADLIEHDYVIKREANVGSKTGVETRTRSVVNVATAREGGKSVESVTKRELYSTWLLAGAALLPAEYARSKRRLRSVTPVLSCLRALWEFMQLSPQSAGPSTREDIRLFTQLAMEKHRLLGLPSETLRPDLLRSFLQNLGCDIAPTAAILGGHLAQDVINVLGQSQQPIQNMVVFDGDRMEAQMFALHPEGELGRGLLSSKDGLFATPVGGEIAAQVP